MTRRPAASWNWLAPMAAGALTMLVAVHTTTLPNAPLASRADTGSLFTFMLNAATSSSNLATFTLSKMDENMEWNVWSHASHHVAAAPVAETRARLENIFNVIPTNR